VGRAARLLGAARGAAVLARFVPAE
jgi:hypothetical protein